MSHTKTPWKELDLGIYANGDPFFNIITADDEVIQDDDIEANAAFIVKAVNEREGLIELLQKIADAADLIPLAEMPTPLFNLIENQVRTALEQAEK